MKPLLILTLFVSMVGIALADDAGLAPAAPVLEFHIPGETPTVFQVSSLAYMNGYRTAADPEDTPARQAYLERSPQPNKVMLVLAPSYLPGFREFASEHSGSRLQLRLDEQVISSGIFFMPPPNGSYFFLISRELDVEGIKARLKTMLPQPEAE